jgi:hypothetical protein
MHNMIDSPHEQFDRRACTYQRLDERLGARTRFFAAAALTNRVLAELCVHRARWLWISRESIVALAALGAILEQFNLQRAQDIRHKMQSSTELDFSFVQMEQALVETVLLRWARSDISRYQRLIAELDRVLCAAAASLPIRGSLSVRRYARVLRLLTGTSGRCLSFGSRSDRISIGQALIEEARKTRLPTGRYCVHI